MFLLLLQKASRLRFLSLPTIDLECAVRVLPGCRTLLANLSAIPSPNRSLLRQTVSLTLRLGFAGHVNRAAVSSATHYQLSEVDGASDNLSTLVQLEHTSEDSTTPIFDKGQNLSLLTDVLGFSFLENDSSATLLLSFLLDIFDRGK